MMCLFQNSSKLNITANGNLINQVSEFNFLCITIDENITWNPHILNASFIIARVIGIFRTLKRIFPWHILRLIYNSLIHPHLLYGLNLYVDLHRNAQLLKKLLHFNIYIDIYISFHISFQKTVDTCAKRLLLDAIIYNILQKC